MTTWVGVLGLVAWDEGDDVRVVVLGECDNREDAWARAEAVAATWDAVDPRCTVADDPCWWEVEDVGKALTGTAEDLTAAGVDVHSRSGVQVGWE